MRHFIFLLTTLLAYTNVNAQLSTNEKPISFDKSLFADSRMSPQKIVLPLLDMVKIEKEDKVDEDCGMPPDLVIPIR